MFNIKPFLFVLSFFIASSSYATSILSCSEVLIKKESSSYSVTFIVPVYRELYSGNLEEFLNSVNQQKNFNGSIKVILVLNNTVEVAKDKKSKIFIENQRTLTAIKSWKKSKKYNFEILVEDLASLGFERNMGKIRQKGVQRYFEEIGKIKETDIIVHADADNVYDSDF